VLRRDKGAIHMSEASDHEGMEVSIGERLPRGQVPHTLGIVRYSLEEGESCGAHGTKRNVAEARSKPPGNTRLRKGKGIALRAALHKSRRRNGKEENGCAPVGGRNSPMEEQIDAVEAGPDQKGNPRTGGLLWRAAGETSYKAEDHLGRDCARRANCSGRVKQ